MRGLFLAAVLLAADVSTIGPKVGDAVADFELPDQTGTSRKLSSLIGPKGAMLVFYRSADW
jgi:peroxiredoxin Q/BCP